MIGTLASNFLENPEERMSNLENLVKLVDAPQPESIQVVHFSPPNYDLQRNDVTLTTRNAGGLGVQTIMDRVILKT